MHYVELYKMISDAKNGKDVDLNEAQRESLYSLVSKGCRHKTKNRLSTRILEHPLSLWNVYGIYRRVHVHPECVSYCAGQSFPDEIRTLRECILE